MVTIFSCEIATVLLISRLFCGSVNKSRRRKNILVRKDGIREEWSNPLNQDIKIETREKARGEGKDAIGKFKRKD